MTQPPYGQSPYGQPQQPYGQPQYPQQYGGAPPQQFGGPPPQNKSPLPWIITAAIVVVAAIGVTLAVVLTGSDSKNGGGGGGDFAGDPVAVTTSFMEAAKKGDASEALQYTCGELYDDIKKSGDNPKGTTGMEYAVSQDAEIDGDKATVDVDIKFNLGTEPGSGNKNPDMTVTANLEKQSGSWKVCSVK